MSDLIEKIKDVERAIAAEKGQINLFAIFERDDLFDRWDLLVAAPWAKRDGPTYGYVADVMKRHLESDDMLRIARIVILDADQEPVLTLNRKFDVEHDEVEVNHPRRYGLLPVKYGYIITSRRAA
jgi:hypothetical protein